MPFSNIQLGLKLCCETVRSAILATAWLLVSLGTGLRHS